MLTVIETRLFQRTWPHYWTEDEGGEFCAFIAENPEAGDVVARSGGVRVIYFTRIEAGEVVLLIMYAKGKLDTLKASTLKELRDATKKMYPGQ